MHVKHKDREMAYSSEPSTPSLPPKILKKKKNETKNSYGKQIYCETLCHSCKIPEITIAGTIP